MKADNQIALFALARLEQQRGADEQASALYRRLKKADPQNLQAAVVLATLLERTGRVKEAKELFQEVVDKKPDSVVAANNLAFYYAQHDPTEEKLLKAEKLLRPLQRKHPNVPQIMDTAAWISYRKGELEKARDILAPFAAKTRQMSTIQYHLGMIYLGLGEKEPAAEALAAALEDGRDFPGKDEARRSLAELQTGGS